MRISDEIHGVVRRLQTIDGLDLRRLCYCVDQTEWDALTDETRQFEPITQWPPKKKEPVTHLVVYGLEVRRR